MSRSDSEPSPGPYVVVPNDGAYVKRPELATLRIEQEHDGLVVAMVVTDCERLQAEGPANARLLAASWDYYMAVERLQRAEEAIYRKYGTGATEQDRCDRVGEFNAARADLWAAHSKAKGLTP